MSDHISPTGHALRVIPDAWIHNAADKLMEQHGADVMTEITRLASLAVTSQERLMMLRVRLAVALQALPNSTAFCTRN